MTLTRFAGENAAPGRTYDVSVTSGGVVLAGGRVVADGNTPRRQLEWHGSTPAAPGRSASSPAARRAGPGGRRQGRAARIFPGLPADTIVVDDPEGRTRGPVPGDRRRPRRACRPGRHRVRQPSTDLPFLHPAFRRPDAARSSRRARRRPGGSRLPVARGYQQPLGRRLPHPASPSSPSALVKEDRPAPRVPVRRVPSRANSTTPPCSPTPALARLDPDLDSVLNVNTTDDYQAARQRPAPEVTVQLFRRPGQGRPPGRARGTVRAGDGPGGGGRDRGLPFDPAT